MSETRGKNCFEDFSQNVEERDGTIRKWVVGVFVGLGNHDGGGFFPWGWKVTGIEARIVNCGDGCDGCVREMFEKNGFDLVWSWGFRVLQPDNEGFDLVVGGWSGQVRVVGWKVWVGVWVEVSVVVKSGEVLPETESVVSDCVKKVLVEMWVIGDLVDVLEGSSKTICFVLWGVKNGVVD